MDPLLPAPTTSLWGVVKQGQEQFHKHFSPSGLGPLHPLPHQDCTPPHRNVIWSGPSYRSTPKPQMSLLASTHLSAPSGAARLLQQRQAGRASLALPRRAAVVRAIAVPEAPRLEDDENLDMFCYQVGRRLRGRAGDAHVCIPAAGGCCATCPNSPRR